MLIRYIASLRAERMHDCQTQDIGFPYDPSVLVLVIDESRGLPGLRLRGL